MNKLIALSLAIGGVGGVMTWIYTSTPLALSIPISFIAWACFVAAGGNNKALSSTVTAWLWGAVVAWLSALVLLPNLGGLPAGLGVPATIAVSVFVLIYGTKVKAFSLAPGAVYGYAAFYTAFLAGTDALQSASLGNPLILTALSGIAGAVLGMVSLNVSASLGK
tara:strand:+ start:829 stop:1323 length:495 start_codon:yes stop_codon:yes gene_type:complete